MVQPSDDICIRWHVCGSLGHAVILYCKDVYIYILVLHVYIHTSNVAGMNSIVSLSLCHLLYLLLRVL